MHAYKITRINECTKSRRNSNKCLRISKGQSQMDNQEKMATQVTQDEENQNKNTTQYMFDTTMRKQTQIYSDIIFVIPICFLQLYKNLGGRFRDVVKNEAPFDGFPTITSMECSICQVSQMYAAVSDR